MRKENNLAVLFLLIIFLFIACNNEIEIKYMYPENSAISGKNGFTSDSNIIYFPFYYGKDTLIRDDFDSGVYRFYTSCLKCAKEPMLYNYYLGHDMYRFLWMRSFDNPVVIIFHKMNGLVWIETKKLNKYPKVSNILITEDNTGLPVKLSYEEMMPSYISFYDYKFFTIKEWNNFENLLNKSNYWDLPIDNEISGLDGSIWIIEGHLKNNYKMVERWCPDSTFMTFGKYLIQLSGIHDRIY
jgi:hypothetical protein